MSSSNNYQPIKRYGQKAWSGYEWRKAFGRTRQALKRDLIDHMEEQSIWCSNWRRHVSHDVLTPEMLRQAMLSLMADPGHYLESHDLPKIDWSALQHTPEPKKSQYRLDSDQAHSPDDMQ